GKKACPPEDCGGIYGYYHLLDAIADPDHEEHDDLTEWLSDDIRARFDSADGLVLEVNFLDNDQTSVQQLMQERGNLPPGDSLKNYLSTEAYDAIVTLGGEVGLPEVAIDRLRPWLAMLQMAALSAVKSGFLPQYGVDITLLTLANQSGKPLTGLETAEYQIGLFADLSDEEAAELIEAGYEELSELKAVFTAMRDHWLAGETEALAEMVNEDFGEDEEWLELFLWQRNRNWVVRLRELMEEQAGTYFVAVGAGHLAGPNNLIALMEADGIAIARE
ncbi:MAG: TraB/GumN family protein, partial [Pseudomonadota bacterium]